MQASFAASSIAGTTTADRAGESAASATARRPPCPRSSYAASAGTHGAATKYQREAAVFQQQQRIQVALSASRLSDADVVVNVHGKYGNRRGKSRVFERKYSAPGV